MASKSKLEDLNLTQDEIKRLGEALKDEKFRDLFREYAEEISDPENRRRYEEEIAQMERDRGMDIVFIRPEPGYVLKTSVDGNKKAFINISKSDKIDKPNAERKKNPDGKTGLMWHIPHSFAPPREDHDKQKNRCQVYDFVVHPDTYRMAEGNVRFKKLVEDTAMDGIEKQFAVTLDRKNVKQPKMKFKGIPSATVIRNRSAGGPQPSPDSSTSSILQDMPYPYDNKTTQEKMKEREVVKEKMKKREEAGASKMGENKTEDVATVPKYTIVHRSEVDMQEYRNSPDAKPSTRPCELVIKIELPLLKSAAQANLDIFEKRLLLESSEPAAYHLDLSLPYPVEEAKGSAKFDKQKQTLLVTLPVVPDNCTVPSFVNGISQAEEEKCSTDTPLVEVLSDSINGELQLPQQTPVNGTAEDELVKNVLTDDDNILDKKKFSPVAYTLPEFSFTQDAETISFVLRVKNVIEDSVKRTSTDSEVLLMCISQGEGGFPLHFSLFLRFADSCKIAPEHCNVDITPDNVVLLLLKERQCRGLWDQIWVGKDSTTVEEQLFLTTNNLYQQFLELDNAATAPKETEPSEDPASVIRTDSSSCDLNVTAVDEKKLTIKITQARNKGGKKWKEEEDDEYDPPSSAEIQVIHTQPSPSLHSILKQRTVSESSEDFNPDPESPRSPIEDEDELSSSFSSSGKRRSVSFSKHIDKATFKSSSSVNSMKTALKSKRKRQRKWEEKKDKASNRRRHNSAGSEGSGDDHSHSHSDSYSLSEEEALDEEGQGDVGQVSRKLEMMLDVRTKRAEDKSINSETSRSAEGSAATSEDLDSGVCRDLDSPQKDGEIIDKSGINIKEEEKDGECLRDVGSMNAENSTDVRNLRDPTIMEPGNLQGSNTDVCPESSSDQGSSEKDDNIVKKIKSKLAEGVPEVCPKDSDDEDEDKKDDHGLGQGADYNEHRTECGFAFSNEVMFDLDME